MQRSVAAAAAFLTSRQTLWPVQQLAHNGWAAAGHQTVQQQCAQHQQLLQLQQQARSMSVAVNVERNNVDKALKILNRHFTEAGMVDELRKRQYRKTSAELKFEQKKAAYNKRVGILIAQRLKWVVRRRKLKI